MNVRRTLKEGFIPSGMFISSTIFCLLKSQQIDHSRRMLSTVMHSFMNITESSNHDCRFRNQAFLTYPTNRLQSKITKSRTLSSSHDDFHSYQNNLLLEEYKKFSSIPIFYRRWATNGPCGSSLTTHMVDLLIASIPRITQLASGMEWWRN